MKSLHIITGQTATGKTKRAIEIAKNENGFLLSADSRQMYQDLHIITGKDVDISTWNGVQNLQDITFGYYIRDDIQIWGCDLIKPNQSFSSYEYLNAVHTILTVPELKGKTPILVGGTYLYIQHTLDGIDTDGVEPDWELRDRLAEYATVELQAELQKMNPNVFDELNESEQSNRQRLMRRIEIEVARQKGIVAQKKVPGLLESGYTVASFEGLRHADRERLAKTITKRVVERLEQGAIEEVEKLLKKGYAKTDPGLKTIGYSQLIDHLEGRSTLQEATERWITAEIQYAKRQYAFMKRDPRIAWTSLLV